MIDDGAAKEQLVQLVYSRILASRVLSTFIGTGRQGVGRGFYDVPPNEFQDMIGKNKTEVIHTERMDSQEFDRILVMCNQFCVIHHQGFPEPPGQVSRSKLLQILLKTRQGSFEALKDIAD